MKRTRIGIAAWGIILLMSCEKVSVPTDYTQSQAFPSIYPDYVNVTIPVNIAPLTFEADEPADEMVASYTSGDQVVVCRGQMQPEMDEWRELTSKAKGDAIKVDVYMSKDGQWTHYKPFNLYVSPDSIDPYISYRLISPSFVAYETLTINQRCLENYEENVIYDNFLCGYEKDGQCINCHHYQNYNPERMQFHARMKHGGTFVSYDGKKKKVNMKNDSILSAGVYPAWHPWLNLIVYSTDKTNQSFHTVDSNKVEVYDLASDIIAYDVENNLVTNLENDTTEFEVFPCWAPDGKTLYYCSGHFIENDSVTSNSKNVVARYKDLKYNIYKKSFDPETMAFGPRELVFDAIAIGQSAVLPRISPDGRFMLFSSADHGYFHIWHRDADLWMMDLKSGDVRKLDELNSPDTESYHSWSSNGRWVIFSSRRDDGTFTRPFIAHVDANGHGSKPFELPSADADYHRLFMRSYNIPEFMRGPVTLRPQDIADILKGDGVDVKYVKQLR
ncbi:MAG: PD40 domain-containing protein [Prevotella sp.]|nr:PD40 domain-containing protein [Prevotella sp.]